MPHAPHGVSPGLGLTYPAGPSGVHRPLQRGFANCVGLQRKGLIKMHLHEARSDPVPGLPGAQPCACLSEIESTPPRRRESTHDSTSAAGSQGSSTRRQSTEAEEELDAFMRTHETVLTDADSVRELRRAGGELVEAFRTDAQRLVVELLSFCRAVVRACEGHGALRAQELGLFGSVIEDATARASRARLAKRLATQALGRARLLNSPRDVVAPLEEPTQHFCTPSNDRLSVTSLPYHRGGEWSVQQCDFPVDAARSGASTLKRDRERSHGSTPAAAATPTSAATTSSAVTLYRGAVTRLVLSSVQSDASATCSNITRSQRPGLSAEGITPRIFFAHFLSYEDAHSTTNVLQRAAQLPPRSPPYRERDGSPAADTCALTASVLCHSPAADSDDERDSAACSGNGDQGADVVARQVASLFRFLRDFFRYGCDCTRTLCAGVHAAVVHVHVREMLELRARDPCCG
jgi:hypothetical protein